MKRAGDTTAQEAYLRSREELIRAVAELGFPAEFGELIARELRGGPWIRRMISYLHNVRPKRIEQVADELIALKDDYENWVRKKQAEESNAVYNAWLNSDRRGREDE